MKLNEIPSGELDALIAEKVMGWTLEDVELRLMHGLVLGPKKNEYYGSCKVLMSPDRKIVTPPNYSANISDAWEVVEKLKSQGLFIAISTRGMEYGCWISNHWIDDDLVWPPDGVGDTAPEAICRAAWALVFYTEMKKYD